MSVLEQGADVIVSITLVTANGPMEFFHDTIDCQQLDCFLAYCKSMGWPAWWVGGGDVFVFVTGCYSSAVEDEVVR